MAASLPVATAPLLDHLGEPAAEFEHFAELSSSKVGGQVLFATDEWFSAASDVIKFDEPVWKEGLFTEQGKWMDGWESRRRRTEGHDWCLIKLGIPGVIKGIVVDTAFFTGNNAPRFSVEVTDDDHLESSLPPYTSIRGHKATTGALEEAETARDSVQWTSLIDTTPLRPGYPETRKHHFPVISHDKWRYLKLNMYPDGGIARIRVFGVVQPDWGKVPTSADGLVDLAAITNGGTAHSWSDTHYGHPSLLLNPGSGVDMGDGWETARKKDRPPVYVKDESGHLIMPGSEWCILKLGHLGCIHHVDVDTAHFKGNFPESFTLEGSRSHWDEGQEDFGQWTTLIERHRLEPDDIERFLVVAPKHTLPVTHVRLRIFPDGGVSRIRVWGKPFQVGKL